jgi:hypothetical protein
VAVSVVIRWLLAAVLAAAALSKVADRRRSREALGGWGLGPRAWAGLVALEGGLAGLLAAGVPGAAWAAAAVFAAFALALGVQLVLGRTGTPCACFGGRGRVGPWALLRTLVLSASAVVAASTDVHASEQSLLVAGLAVALAGIGALGVAVLALARELGELRLRLPAQAALSIPDEGPRLGAPAALGFGGPFRRGLAVFISDGCPACAGVEPAVRVLGREPGLSIRVYDEARDAAVWQELRVPGSPYAVVVDAAGTVVAKGTFNTLAQLEGLLAVA